MMEKTFNFAILKELNFMRKLEKIKNNPNKRKKKQQK